MEEETKILNEIITNVRNHPSFGKLRNCWSREGEYQHGLISFAGEIFIEYKQQNQVTLSFFINQKISELILAIKKTDREAWLPKKTDFIQNIKHPQDNNLIASPQDRKTTRDIKEVSLHLKPLGDYFQNHSQKNKVKPLIASLGKTILGNINDATSIYRMAIENRVDLRRLLYTLRTIEFPILHTKRYPNAIHMHYLPLFKEIFPRIKTMWEQEDNYKRWVHYFRNDLCWEKSRVANFMKRRIKDKIVPVYFFDIFPISLSPQLWPSLKNKDKKLIELCRILTKMFNLNEDKIQTHREMKKNLINYCLRCSKTLLSSL